MSESPVEISEVDGLLAIYDRVDGVLVRRFAPWMTRYQLVRIGGRYLPTCVIDGIVAPDDLQAHADGHGPYEVPR